MTSEASISKLRGNGVSGTNVSIPDFRADVNRPMDLLRLCPAYRATTCHSIESASTGVLFLKDETERMALGSFKALGGVYAVAALIADQWQDFHGRELLVADYDQADVRTFADSLTFTCASAGNHGLAVAAGARIFGAHSRIYLANTVPQAFADRLLEKGAEVVRSGATYEDSVAAAACLELEQLGFQSTPSGAAGLAGLNKFFLLKEVADRTRPLVIVTEGRRGECCDSTSSE